MKLKSIKTIIIVAICICIFGCEEQQKKKVDKPLKAAKSVKAEKLIDDGKVLLSVDFEKGQISKYKFISEREIALHWDPSSDESKSAADKVDYTNEKVEIVMAYEPIEVDPYGLTTIKCSCESVAVEQTTSKNKESKKVDAVKSFEGKSFNLVVGPTGKIEDYNDLTKVLQEVGNKAFREGGKEGVRIKEPDMIEDVIATQWFLWDSVGSLGTAGADGIETGFKWQSVLSAPTPLVTTQARSVEYQLSEIRNSQTGKQFVIKSTYSPADRKLITWPMPYSGRFQVSGPFGFLTMFIKNFEVTSLQGSGVEILQADNGQAVSYKQDYKMVLESTVKSSLGTKPRLEIKQNFTMERLAE